MSNTQLVRVTHDSESRILLPEGILRAQATREGSISASHVEVVRGGELDPRGQVGDRPG